jgi:hypothetical protein
MARVLVPLCAYLVSCYGRRISQHKVFDGLAARGHNSADWFFGFKLHLIVNDRGEWLAGRLTPGKVDDRTPVPALVKRVFGKLFGDKGNLSQTLFAHLFEQGIQRVTNIRANMTNRRMLLTDRVLLRRRAILESIYDPLKNLSQIEHTRHRSLANLMVNLLAGLIAYCHQPKKPSLHLADPPMLVALAYPLLTLLYLLG